MRQVIPLVSVLLIRIGGASLEALENLGSQSGLLLLMHQDEMPPESNLKYSGKKRWGTCRINHP